MLFLDEPTTGLDPEVRVAMWEEISTLAREEGLTILLTTHYLEEADQLASQLAIVDRGKIVAEGSPEQLKAELRGDAISVELDQDGARARRCTTRSRASTACARSRSTAACCAPAPTRARAPCRRCWRRSRARAFGCGRDVARASLDDVYLRHTGRTFSQAEGDGAAAEPEPLPPEAAERCPRSSSTRSS